MKRMDDDQQHLSNQSAEAAPISRRPGKPKGHPKPPGSGRKPGTPNRVTRDIKALALKDAPVMLRELKRLALNATDEKTRLGAVNAWLDRAVGKPMAPSEVTGKDGEPLIPAPADTIDVARRMLFMVEQAKATAKAAAPVERPKEPAPPPPPPGAPYSGPTLTTEPEKPPQHPLADSYEHAHRAADREARRSNITPFAPRRPYGR